MDVEAGDQCEKLMETKSVNNLANGLSFAHHLPSFDTDHLSHSTSPARERKTVKRGGSFRKVGQNLGQINTSKDILKSVLHLQQSKKYLDQSYRSDENEVHEYTESNHSMDTDFISADRLILAAKEENYRELSMYLLKGKLDVIDAGDKYGMTALHYAALLGQSNSLELLLTSGAKVDVLDRQGRSPLYYAVQGGNFDCATILINFGADIAIIKNGYYDGSRTTSRKSLPSVLPTITGEDQVENEGE